MRFSNTVVSVIVIAAVLVAAYAMGLLIRQARTGGSRVQPPAEVNDTAAAKRTEVALHGPGATRTKDTPEERARVKEEKAKALEERNSSTDEQKEEYRNQVHKQVGGRRSGKGLPNTLPQSRQTQKIKAQRRSEAGRQREDVNTPASQGETPNAQPSSDKTGPG